MTENKYISQVLVDFAQQAYIAGLPAQVTKKLYEFLIDKIGLELAGSQFPWSLAGYHATVLFPAKGCSTVVYYGDQVSPEQAAFINAGFGHAQDFDDTDVQSRIHASGIMIPTAFAVGEAVDASGLQVGNALAIGMEIMSRLGSAVPSSHIRGFHTPDVVGPFGAAITTGLLLNLNAGQMVNAMGIAGSFSGGVEEYTRTGGAIKRYLPGIAAIAGIKAAYLAKEGLTGPPSVIEGHHGICNTFDDGTYISKITDKLTEEYVILNTAFKPYNCCYAIHAALEAFVSVCHEHNIQPDDIKDVEVGSSKFVVDHVGSIREPDTVVEAQFSLSFMLALSLVKSPPGEYDVTDEVVQNKDIRLLASKISMIVDKIAEQEQAESMSSNVKVTTNAGDQFQKRVRFSKGTTQNPMTLEELKTKFRNNLQPICSATKIESLLELIAKFDTLKNIKMLTSAIGEFG